MVFSIFPLCSSDLIRGRNVKRGDTFQHACLTVMMMVEEEDMGERGYR